MLAYMWDEWKWSLDLSEPADSSFKVSIIIGIFVFNMFV